MKRYLLSLILMVIATVSAAAASGSSYDFSDHIRRMAASEHALWQRMMERHGHESALLERCFADRKQCPLHLRGLRRLLLRAEGLNPHAQLVLINRFINKRRYVTDTKDPDLNAGHWHTLNHFMRDGGDCEDYAIAKYFALRHLGFEKNQLRVVISYDTRARDFHAMLAVELDGRSHFLENDNTILRGGKQRTYAVSYAINEDYWWDHGMDRVGSRYSKPL